MPIKEKLGWIFVLLFCGSMIFLGLQIGIIRDMIENETCNNYCIRKQFGSVIDIINTSTTLPDETILRDGI